MKNNYHHFPRQSLGKDKALYFIKIEHLLREI